MLARTSARQRRPQAWRTLAGEALSVRQNPTAEPLRRVLSLTEMGNYEVHRFQTSNGGNDSATSALQLGRPVQCELSGRKQGAKFPASTSLTEESRITAPTKYSFIGSLRWQLDSST